MPDMALPKILVLPSIKSLASLARFLAAIRYVELKDRFAGLGRHPTKLLGCPLRAHTSQMLHFALIAAMRAKPTFVYWKTAHSRHPTIFIDAAARPVRPDLRCDCEIFYRETSAAQRNPM